MTTPRLAATAATALRHAASGPPPLVFSRATKRHQRDMAAQNPAESRATDYLREAVAEAIADRFHDITRRFPVVLDVGAAGGHVAKYVTPDKIDRMIHCDDSAALLHRDRNHTTYPVPVQYQQVEQDTLPFEADSMDAAVSCLSLHWANDLTGALAQINRVIKPDGPFIGAMLGNSTLYELRTSLQQTDVERHGGIRQHISPMADAKDVASLLTLAGFTLTTVDLDRVTINYPTMFELLYDLKAMGETNAHVSRDNFIGVDTLMAAAATYAAVYRNPDGSIPATFDVIHMIGWKASESQPKPKERGSAKVSLKDVL